MTALFRKRILIPAGIFFLAAIGTNPVSAAIVAGTFEDPLLSERYPSSTLTGRFSYNSESTNAQGLVSWTDIFFRSIETSNYTDGFNGSGWEFFLTAPGGNETSFVFNTQTNLFEGRYALERTCRTGEGCPPGTLGQQIIPIGDNGWDPAPKQTVVLTSVVPEPTSTLGTLLAAGAGVCMLHKRKKNLSGSQPNEAQP